MVTEIFADVLMGVEFLLLMDNNSIVHLKTAELGALKQRWITCLSKFRLKTQSHPGWDADALSHNPIKGHIGATLNGRGVSAGIELFAGYSGSFHNVCHGCIYTRPNG